MRIFLSCDGPAAGNWQGDFTSSEELSTRLELVLVGTEVTIGVPGSETELAVAGVRASSGWYMIFFMPDGEGWQPLDNEKRGMVEVDLGMGTGTQSIKLGQFLDDKALGELTWRFLLDEALPTQPRIEWRHG